jgi:hypothetical protein
MTIASIRKKLKEFNAAASTDPAALQSAWSRVFKTDLSTKSANAFADYYRNMRSQTKKQRGGAAAALSPAPLSYETVPGANVAVYGRFPVEAATDMPSILNMDVYFQNSLTAGCGVQDSSLRVPVDMGSNKVGGRRSRAAQRRGTKNMRKTYRKRNAARKASTLRRRSAVGGRKRGGSLLESIGSRLYMATAPPNTVQLTSNNWAGMAAPVSGRPEVAAWNYRSSGTDGLINPGMVSRIDGSFQQLANPAPWQSSN